MAGANHDLFTGGSIECTDVTARKVHQYAVVGIMVLSLLIGGPVGAALLIIDGVVMLAGRFWGPADVFRQIVWRIAQPRGWLQPNLVPEDMTTRRVARVMGGVWLLVTGAVVYSSNMLLATVLVVPLAAMILSDAAINFCALCFVYFYARRLQFLLMRPA